jgi:hypothetical protein
VVFSNILGIFFMAHSLKHISVILADLVKELKENNDKWEIANESQTTLRPSDDGATPERSIRDITLCNRGEEDEHTQ